MGSRLRTRSSSLFAGFTAFCATLAATGSSWACPSCPVGQLARQQVCERDFGQNLLVAALPFFAMAMIAAYAERIGKV